MQPFVQPGARLLALSSNASTPAEVARLLCERGYGRSRLTVLSHLGGEAERTHRTTAESYRRGDEVADLNTLAIECVVEPDAPLVPRTPGLPDELYEHDGQLTKREVRAVTLAALAPVPGQLLWDVGAGCGSIGIEWMRTHPECRAIAVEPDTRRIELIAANSAALGTPGLGGGEGPRGPRSGGPRRARRHLRGRRDHRARPCWITAGPRSRPADAWSRTWCRSKASPCSATGSAPAAAASPASTSPDASRWDASAAGDR